MRYYLYEIRSLPHVYLLGAAVGIAVFLLLALAIWARFGRYRVVTVRSSEPINMVAVQLGRIADAIDHLAYSIEVAPNARAAFESPRPSTEPALRESVPPAPASETTTARPPQQSRHMVSLFPR